MTSPIAGEREAGRYRKKPVVIDAFCLDGGPMPDWFLDARSADVVQTFSQGTGNPFDDPLTFAYIHTMEGVMRAERGDWIIRGIKGEMYPCKPDIFAATYEPAAALLEPVGDGWQPIETAPKDGTTILVLDELYAKPWHYECEWNSVEWYHGFGDAWPKAMPTHWMPLPASPKTNGGMGS